MEPPYHKLLIYQKAHSLAVEIHRMTLRLPKFEMYEEGSQVRRSSKSVVANIFEGYSHRKHKNDWLLYLERVHGSAQETVEHLSLLVETGSLIDKEMHDRLATNALDLCKLLFRFIKGVMDQHEKPHVSQGVEDE